MTEKVFWSIIANATKTAGSVDDCGPALIDLLVKLPPDEIVAFGWLFDQKTDAAYRRDLWDAASLINGGASDDGFYYFRCWLVGMGRDVYENALANPDTLADVVDDDDIAEAEIYYVARTAWQQVTGKEPDAEYEAATERLGPRKGEAEIEGEDMDEDAIRKHWPKLAARYLNPAEDDE